MTRFTYLLFALCLTISSCDKKNIKKDNYSSIIDKDSLNISYSNKKNITENENLKEKLSLKSEKSTCIIKKIQKIDSTYLVIVDFIELECFDDEVEFCTVINNNPKLRTYILPNELFQENIETLKDYKEIEKSGACFYNIETSKGKITSLGFFCLS